jgi:hypothetical protein
MLRRLLTLILAVAATCTAAPAFAQATSNDAMPEPALLPGTTAFRIANESDCPVLVRAKTNGEVVTIGAIRPHSTGWFHARAAEVTHEIEVVVTPRACGMKLIPLTPAEPAAVPPPSPPLGPRARANGFAPASPPPPSRWLATVNAQAMRRMRPLRYHRMYPALVLATPQTQRGRPRIPARCRQCRM